MGLYQGEVGWAYVGAFRLQVGPGTYTPNEVLLLGVDARLNGGKKGLRHRGGYLLANYATSIQHGRGGHLLGGRMCACV